MCAIQSYCSSTLLKIEMNTSKKGGGGGKRYRLFAIVIARINMSLEHIKNSLRDVMLRDTDISLTQLMGLVCGILLEKWYHVAKECPSGNSGICVIRYVLVLRANHDRISLLGSM